MTGTKRPRKAAAAIAALLISPSIDEAARRVGLGEKTLRRWLRDPQFAAELQEAQRRAFGDSLGALQAATPEAVATLRVAMAEDVPWAARVKAAALLLEHAARAVDRGDLERRVAALEERDEMARAAGGSLFR